MDYRREIRDLLLSAPVPVDLDLQAQGRPPTQASSHFLTNREQGTWAEDLALRAINAHAGDLRAVHYGEKATAAAGEPGFSAHYAAYQNELNTIGKRPDILLFRSSDLPDPHRSLDPDTVERAVAGLEVRSSSFLADRYGAFMDGRTRTAESRCLILRQQILTEPYASLLARKNPVLHDLLRTASVSTLRELSFRQPSWRSTPDLRHLTDLLKAMKQEISVLHRRDYLSITPKVEDLVMVNRWIQTYGVRHYYMQVFFDKAYLISFLDILRMIRDPGSDGPSFRIEEDVKNQGKTTIKINIAVSTEVIGRIRMPRHCSEMRELDRGRLLFYVRFDGGIGYLDREAFLSAISPDG